jgi:thiosulfate dehydrogenase [quinone] large subunit
MSVKETPTSTRRISSRNTVAQTTGPEAVTISPTAAKLLAATRIATGFVFLWAFLDKLFGLGYATPDKNAWINGGSPTKGFLGGVDHGPFQNLFNDMAGNVWADRLFMLGLAGIGLAVMAGIGMRVAAVSATVMMLLMWVAEWPLAQHTSTGELTRSTNPLMDYHIIYALVLLTLAALYAGRYYGLGERWARLDIVRRNPWLI